MKNTKDTLKEEVKYRISLIEEKMEEELKKPKDDDNLYWFFTQEHLNYSEFYKMIVHFERIATKYEIVKEKYTPIVCEKTKTPLLIGDKVENEKKQCGTLYFDDFWNQYMIKSTSGIGHLKFKSIYKIEEFYDYEIDSTRVECRNGR